MTAWTVPFRERMHQQPCTYCGVKAGESCITKTGKHTGPHSARFYATKEADRKAEEDGRLSPTVQPDAQPKPVHGTG